MSEIRLIAEVRTEFGKGGARRTRRAGKIPAVIYGHGADPRHVSLPAREFTQLLKKNGANVLLTLEVDGVDELAIPKAVQRHAIKGVYEHVDLITVRRGEKVTVEVPLVLEGDIAPGGLLAQDQTTVSVEAEATHLPTEITVKIEGLQVGTVIHASDLVLPSGSSLASDPESLILQVNAAPTAEDLEGEVAEAVAELGIVEDKPDSEEGAAPSAE
ncbi:50S ribosomal protein L25/general stress protein Ctc [soil metagenome]|jgi:large subunit ribosomal protein L25